MKVSKIEKNVQPILNITKNIIKRSDEFNNYYIHEDNNLYQNQLPLLVNRSRIKEIVLHKKLNKIQVGSNKKFDQEPEEKKIDYSQFPLSNIRNIQIRSKKLPPLCPFYNEKGELLREVVKSSKAKTETNFYTEGNIKISFGSTTSYKFLPSSSPLKTLNQYMDSYKKSNITGNYEINFDEFEKEILYESKFKALKYNNADIFGHKEFYNELINGLVDEIKTTTSESEDKIKDQEAQKEKDFEWGKNKKKITLTLNSLTIKIKEVVQDDNKNSNEENKAETNKIYFEYQLPFNLMPLFYYKGFEKFKYFIISLIRWDDRNKKFEVNENMGKIINNLLTNCKDLKLEKENEEDLDFEDLNVAQVDFKKTLAVSDKMNFKLDKEKKNSKILSSTNKPFNPLGMSFTPNSLFAGTNVDAISKKKMATSKFNLYPKEQKESDFINYNIFEFYWNISNKIFFVSVLTPLITFCIPSYNILVHQFINYELLLYLFKINFDSWDFYVIKYLSSFKKFRILLSQITSIFPKKNKNFYLENKKIKKFDSTDCNIINVITSNVEISERTEDKKETKRDMKSTILEKIEESNEDYKNENKEDKKPVENKGGEKTEAQNEEKKEEIKVEPTTEEDKDGKKGDETSNYITNSVQNMFNSILEQECFIAIVKFTDPEKNRINQYNIHFNYSHFKKFESMEKYMKKTSFLLKFIDVNYDNSTIDFDYESLNAFDEKKWTKELEKYNSNLEMKIENIVNKDELKMGISLISTKNLVEYAGSKKGTTISIDIKLPIIFLKSIDRIGNLQTQRFAVFEEDFHKLLLSKNNDVVNLSKNIYEIALEHNRKEIEEKKMNVPDFRNTKKRLTKK